MTPRTTRPASRDGVRDGVRGRRGLLARLLVAALALPTALLFAGSPAAYAHAALIGSDPAEGDTLAAVPGEITLTFNEDMRGPAYVVITAPSGEAADGEPVIDGAEVVQQVSADAEPGTWTLAYRVVSGDGHPVSGEFDFTVEGDGGSPAGDDGTGATDAESEATPGSQGDTEPAETAAQSSSEAAAGRGAEEGWWSRHTDHVLIVVGLLAVAGALIAVSFRRSRA